MSPDGRRAARAARARLGRAADRGAGRSGLGDDEPGGAAADPRRPLLRPHADVPKRPPGAIPFEIDASLAFGTGQHATTERLPRSARQARARGRAVRATSPTSAPERACWPSPRWRCGREAKCIATDIDAVAVEVARDNAAINGVKLGHGAGELLLARGRRHGLAAARRARAVRPHHRQHPRRSADRARAGFREGARRRAGRSCSRACSTRRRRRSCALMNEGRPGARRPRRAANGRCWSRCSS